MDEDTDKSQASDEEYHFTEEDVSDAFAAPTSDRKKGRFGFINKRTLIYAVGFVILVLAVYKLLGVYEGGDEAVTPTEPVVTQPAPIKPVAKAPSVPPAPKPITPPAQLVQQPVEVQPTADDITAVKQQLEDIQEHNTATRSQIDEIDSQLGNLAAAMNSLQNSLASVNQKLDSMASLLHKQEMQMAKLIAKQRARKKRAKKKRIIHRPVYYIQALIPNRAWLVKPNGDTLTVVVGSSLKEYGKIKAIDVVNGRVLTTSGVIIRYRNG